MIRHRLVLAAALLASSAALAAKAPKIPVAPPSAAACAECHGANGVAGAASVPHLNGQIPDNIVEALEQFQAGKRPSSTPAHASPDLTPQEIGALARFYGAQRAQRPAQPVDEAKVSAAAAVYERRCAKCHLENGRESDHEAPLLAGQSLEYLQAQTTAFVSGKRKFPFLMDEAYQGLAADDLDRLSHYFASQKQ